MFVYEFCNMALETNRVAELFVSHIDLTFNEEDNVVVGDNDGYSSKAKVFDSNVKEEVGDECDIGVDPSSNRGGGVGNFEVDRDFIGEGYTVRDDDDLFDNVVDEADYGDASGDSSNQEIKCHVPENSGVVMMTLMHHWLERISVKVLLKRILKTMQLS